jgi:hypothetical protein
MHNLTIGGGGPVHESGGGPVGAMVPLKRAVAAPLASDANTAYIIRQ